MPKLRLSLRGLPRLNRNAKNLRVPVSSVDGIERSRSEESHGRPGLRQSKRQTMRGRGLGCDGRTRTSGASEESQVADYRPHAIDGAILPPSTIHHFV